MRSKPTVLVVEDETLIRMFAADIASDAGFRVLEASDAQEALRQLERDLTIGIIFTDIHMPGSVDGLNMTHTARDRRPPLRFLVVSGHRQPAPNELPEGSRFVPKPYTTEEIAEALDELADEWGALTV